MQDYRSLRIWNDSIELALAVYRATSKFPPEEKFGIVAQMRRAGVSIASNIAEGCARSGRRDFLRFLEIALGSGYELDTQLLLGKDLGWIDEEDPVFGLLENARRGITALIVRVRERGSGG